MGNITSKSQNFSGGPTPVPRAFLASPVADLSPILNVGHSIAQAGRHIAANKLRSEQIELQSLAQQKRVEDKTADAARARMRTDIATDTIRQLGDAQLEVAKMDPALRTPFVEKKIGELSQMFDDIEDEELRASLHGEFARTFMHFRNSTAQGAAGDEARASRLAINTLGIELEAKVSSGQLPMSEAIEHYGTAVKSQEGTVFSSEEEADNEIARFSARMGAIDEANRISALSNFLKDAIDSRFETSAKGPEALKQLDEVVIEMIKTEVDNKAMQEKVIDDYYTRAVRAQAVRNMADDPGLMQAKLEDPKFKNYLAEAGPIERFAQLERVKELNEQVGRKAGTVERELQLTNRRAYLSELTKIGRVPSQEQAINFIRRVKDSASEKDLSAEDEAALISDMEGRIHTTTFNKFKGQITEYAIATPAERQAGNLHLPDPNAIREAAEVDPELRVSFLREGDRDRLLGVYEQKSASQSRAKVLTDHIANGTIDRDNNPKFPRDNESMNDVYLELRERGVGIFDSADLFVSNGGGNLPTKLDTDIDNLFDQDHPSFDLTEGLQTLQLLDSIKPEEAFRLSRQSDTSRVAFDTATSLARMDDIQLALASPEVKGYLETAKVMLDPSQEYVVDPTRELGPLDGPARDRFNSEFMLAVAQVRKLGVTDPIEAAQQAEAIAVQAMRAHQYHEVWTPNVTFFTGEELGPITWLGGLVPDSYGDANTLIHKSLIMADEVADYSEHLELANKWDPFIGAPSARAMTSMAFLHKGVVYTPINAFEGGTIAFMRYQRGASTANHKVDTAILEPQDTSGTEWAELSRKATSGRYSRHPMNWIAWNESYGDIGIISYDKAAKKAAEDKGLIPPVPMHEQLAAQVYSYLAYIGELDGKEEPEQQELIGIHIARHIRMLGWPRVE